MTWMMRFRILPLLVVVAALSFGVRFGDFVTGVSQNPGSAVAQETAAQADEAIADEAKEEGEKANEAMSDGEGLGEPPTSLPTERPDMSEGKAVEWRDSTEEDFQNTSIRLELFEDLKVRRKDIERQQRELSVREALLKTAEQELDQKYEELVSLKAEIESLLEQQSEEEQKRIVSLVKIYEGMKPKDAARIFNTLDLDILLAVVGRMSERKSAPIIAAMSPERAKTLTTMLMDQKTLADVTNNFNQ
jgi:flagellar motility protein MotE (MotC chaperone)